MSTEHHMRAETAPTPESIGDLASYIDGLVRREHDYGTSVYAMSLAAVAAFNYVAKTLGVTGFQASCADLDVIRRTRHLAGPFMLVDAEKALFPQYDLHAELDDAIAGWGGWLGEQAAAHLQQHTDAHPNVVAHWKKLAEKRP